MIVPQEINGKSPLSNWIKAYSFADVSLCYKVYFCEGYRFVFVFVLLI